MTYIKWSFKPQISKKKKRTVISKIKINIIIIIWKTINNLKSNIITCNHNNNLFTSNNNNRMNFINLIQVIIIVKMTHKFYTIPKIIAHKSNTVYIMNKKTTMIIIIIINNINNHNNNCLIFPMKMTMIFQITLVFLPLVKK